MTRARARVTPYSSAQAEPNLAVVDVGDDRVLRLAEIYKPKKTTWATVEIVDFVGLVALTICLSFAGMGVT